jgi:hypothetical protein
MEEELEELDAIDLCYRGSEGLGVLRVFRGLGKALNSQLLNEPRRLLTSERTFRSL